LPIILYNVPSRTGVDLAPDTVKRLAMLDNICGIKEAKGSLSRLREQIDTKIIPVYTGCDGEMLDVLELGGFGVISVVSNLYPRRVARLHKLYENGDTAGACEIFGRLKPVIDALFIDTNPAPIKYALSRLGLCEEDMRLPMYPIGEAERRAVDLAMDNFGEE
jgi:4-hydroxy-tetrahydrodipicolinate synthase